MCPSPVHPSRRRVGNHKVPFVLPMAPKRSVFSLYGSWGPEAPRVGFVFIFHSLPALSSLLSFFCLVAHSMNRCKNSTNLICIQKVIWFLMWNPFVSITKKLSQNFSLRSFGGNDISSIKTALSKNCSFFSHLLGIPASKQSWHIFGIVFVQRGLIWINY